MYGIQKFTKHKCMTIFLNIFLIIPTVQNVTKHNCSDSSLFPDIKLFNNQHFNNFNTVIAGYVTAYL